MRRLLRWRRLFVLGLAITLTLVVCGVGDARQSAHTDWSNHPEPYTLTFPGDLMQLMRDTFTHTAMSLAFGEWREDVVGDYLHLPEKVVLFGEGYGPGIQQGGHYREDKSFTLFDVVIDGRWQRWSEVERVAEVLGVDTPPVLGRGMDTYNVQALVSMMCDCVDDPEWRGQLWHGPWLSSNPEGIIARTDPYLFDSQGRLVKFKHKVRDVAKYLETLEVAA